MVGQEKAEDSVVSLRFEVILDLLNDSLPELDETKLTAPKMHSAFFLQQLGRLRIREADTHRFGVIESVGPLSLRACPTLEQSVVSPGNFQAGILCLFLCTASLIHSRQELEPVVSIPVRVRINYQQLVFVHNAFREVVLQEMAMEMR